MIAVVEQSLRHVHRGDISTLILQTVEDELMTAGCVDGQFVDILQRLLDIVRIEGGQGTHLFDMFTAQREDIGVGPHHHGEVAIVGRHVGEVFLQSLTNTDRATTGTTTAVRRGECLMEVDVHHVEAHITRTTGSEHGVQVRPVVVHQSAAVVDEFCYLRDARLEEAKGIGIGHHHGGDISPLLSNDALQVVYIDRTISLRLHLDDLQSADGSRGGVRAVGRIGHNHLLALQVAMSTVEVVDGHQTCQFTMGTGIGFEGEVVQSCEGTERLLQEDYQRPSAHHRMLRLQRVQVLELWQGCHLLVDLRIVLHRTGTEGIEARIDTEVII